MPWSIKRRDGKFCVVKEGGKVEKCHASRADAVKHQRALYANEPSARTASVAAVAPLKPPAEWFSRPENPEPTALTILADGQVYGHLAPWGTCHTGFLNGAMEECVQAPRSATGYTYFHLGQLETEEGGLVAVGKLTYATEHAPMSAGLQAATSHYDHTGSVAAFVRASDGEHGIWLAGALRSDLPAEGKRDLLANPLSGDWRLLNRSLELVASLAVPVPGFPIPRSELALAASGEVQALILTTAREEIQQGRSIAFKRERAVLTARV